MGFVNALNCFCVLFPNFSLRIFLFFSFFEKKDHGECCVGFCIEIDPQYVHATGWLNDRSNWKTHYLWRNRSAFYILLCDFFIEEENGMVWTWPEPMGHTKGTNGFCPVCFFTKVWWPPLSANPQRFGGVRQWFSVPKWMPEDQNRVWEAELWSVIAKNIIPRNGKRNS